MDRGQEGGEQEARGLLHDVPAVARPPRVHQRLLGERGGRAHARARAGPRLPQLGHARPAALPGGVPDEPGRDRLTHVRDRGRRRAHVPGLEPVPAVPVRVERHGGHRRLPPQHSRALPLRAGALLAEGRGPAHPDAALRADAGLSSPLLRRVHHPPRPDVLGLQAALLPHERVILQLPLLLRLPLRSRGVRAGGTVGGGVLLRLHGAPPRHRGNEQRGAGAQAPRGGHHAEGLLGRQPGHRGGQGRRVRGGGARGGLHPMRGGLHPMRALPDPLRALKHLGLA
mmetsp:Transcript_45720/g.145652  ORF Transcript_45720/g.145652 Transcript_45720/m.145652 type:complete len:284 (+) Transcript_45720:1367-2218(+)